MVKSDKIILGLILGAVFPVLFSLIAIAVGFYFFSERTMPYLFGIGLIAGFIVDILFIRKLLSVMFDVPFWIFAVFYILCSVFLYGIFMGLPVPQLIMGPLAGYYWGRRISLNDIVLHEREDLITKVSRFSAVIMTLVCISSAFIALNEITIGEELEHMLGLNFIPSYTLIVSGIIVGGITLIIFQYLLTRIVLMKTIKANFK